MIKLKVVHFYNGLGGGVQTLIAHFINFKVNQSIDYEIVYVIEKSNVDKLQKIPLRYPVREHYVVYDQDWNYYHTIKKIQEIVEKGAVLVAHDWVELGMISQLKMSNSIISFLHGNYEYYYNLYHKHKEHVNLFLSVTNTLVVKMRNEGDVKAENLIHYPIPVIDFEKRPKDYTTLKVLFIANDLQDSNKNFDFLPLIDKLLIERGVQVEWHIVGQGKCERKLLEDFKGAPNRIKYYGYIKNDKLPHIFEQVNVFFNCSDKEGLPVSLIESMKSGLIPVVNSWSGSACEIIRDKIDGFIVLNNCPEDYANILCYLYYHREQLPEFSRNAFQVASTCHDFKNQINIFENQILKLSQIKSIRHPQKIYGSRLDEPYIPNFVTYLFRKILKRLHG